MGSDGNVSVLCVVVCGAGTLLKTTNALNTTLELEFGVWSLETGDCVPKTVKTLLFIAGN